MERIRIGTNISIVWHIFVSAEFGESFVLEDKINALKIYIRSPHDIYEVPYYLVEGDTIKLNFSGQYQRYTGVHALVLKDTTDGERTLCKDFAFELVKHLDEESSEDNEEKKIISLNSSILVSKSGESAYEVWLRLGNSGTPEDFFKWLRGGTLTNYSFLKPLKSELLPDGVNYQVSLEDEFLDNIIKGNYISKDKDDDAYGRITFHEGFVVDGKTFNKAVRSTELEGTLTDRQLISAYAVYKLIENLAPEIPDHYIRKDIDDVAQGLLTFLKGTNWGRYTNESGAAMNIDPDTGQSSMVVDRLKVRLKAYFEELEVQKVSYSGGKLILTVGEGVDFIEVEETTDSSGEVISYRCYFLGEQDGVRVNNLIQPNDLLICEPYNITPGVTEGVSNKYYWRKVLAVSKYPVQRGSNVCHWIELSATDCDTDSDIPEAGDTACHLGNTADPKRQGAIILSVVDEKSPSITIYAGIDSYSLVDKEYVESGVYNGKAYHNVYGNAYIGDRKNKEYRAGYVEWDDDKKQLDILGRINVSSQMSDSGKTLREEITAAKDEYIQSYTTLNSYVQTLEKQVDGSVDTYFYEPEPTLENFPASEWTDEKMKNMHLGDLYYSGSGTAYRFQLTDGVYSWVIVTDTAITLALSNAQKAQDTADGKRRIFTTTPYPPYDVGDLWSQGSTGELMVCIKSRATGTFDPTEWGKASKYTDDTKANEAYTLAGTAIDAAADLNEQTEAIRNLTDSVLADNVITEAEKASVQKALSDIRIVMGQVSSTYEELVKNNVYGLIPDDLKNLFGGSYSELVAKYDTLTGYISDIIGMDKVTSAVITELNSKYDAFETEYKKYSGYLAQVNNAINSLLNTKIVDLTNELGGYEYLKNALSKEETLIQGGLILSSLIGLGYTEETGGEKAFHVMSGISGLVDESDDKGIAFWAGGSMIDREKNPEAENSATFVVRHDGTGYAAAGNLSWDKYGNVKTNGNNFYVGDELVGNLFGLFGPNLENNIIVSITPLKPFTELGFKGTSKTPKFYVNNDVLYLDGDLAVSGGITMYASGGVVSGIMDQILVDGTTIGKDLDGKLYAINTGNVKGVYVNGSEFKPDSNGIITLNDYPTSLAWGTITDKPTTIAGYGITDAKIVNGVITLGTATITPLTAHQTVTLASGTNNGTLKLTVNGTATDNIAVKGLGSAAFTASSAYAAASHTHSYAGSSSAGGAAYSANKLTTARSIFGQNFDGSAAINGQGVFYGTYNSTASDRYGHSALQIRENGLVTTNQSELAYAPSIGFHWSGRTAATLLYGSDGVFYLRKQDFTTRASLDANLVGNAATATTATKLGTANVGSGTQHFYLNAGTATASTSTVGGTAKPIYLNGGTLTAISTTAGSTTLPVYLNAGTITACTASSVFSNLSNSGNSLSVTVAGQNRTLTVNYASNAGNADTLDGYHLSSIIRVVALSNAAMDANNLTTSNVIYYPNHDLSTNKNSWSNFPTTKPDGGFNLLNLSSGAGGYKSQIYIRYNDNHIYTRTQKFSTSGNVWNTWSQLALMGGTANTGDFLVSGGITMYSDLRKKNILSDEVLSVKEIALAPLFAHTYKSDENHYLHIGTSAQYWSAMHEGWFTRKDSEGYYQMELQNLGVAMGISLAREIVKYESKTDKKIRLMKKKINDLEEANKALDARIKELEERRTA